VRFVGLLDEDMIAPEVYVGVQLDENSKYWRFVTITAGLHYGIKHVKPELFQGSIEESGRETNVAVFGFLQSYITISIMYLPYML
jgi:hypothetical protein